MAREPVATEGTAASLDKARLDVWLWRARFFKTRALAAAHVASHGVRLTRPGREPVKVEKPATAIGPGDVLAWAVAHGSFGPRGHAVRVLSIGTRRGPPAEAQTLFEPVV
jgi:ribosome-associated heat shock protein Hsp15